MMDFSIFEALMLIAFGVSWPLAIVRSARARSSKGKSLAYLILLDLAYVSGILHKTLINLDIVLALYIFNFIMVSIDLVLYFRNARFDRLENTDNNDSITAG